MVVVVDDGGDGSTVVVGACGVDGVQDADDDDGDGADDDDAVAVAVAVAARWR